VAKVAIGPRTTVHLTAQTEFSGADFRAAVGTFATGITVITTRGEDHLFGMTANAFSSVSLDPPLILVCVIKGTTGAAAIEGNKVFAVNILGSDQEAISRYFASKDRPRGLEAFDEIPHVTAVTGSPIIESAAGFLDCTLYATHDAGDHLIFIGEVRALGFDPEVQPIVFHAGRYRVAVDA
jgi:flavin reductase (DIM6/NTAB) family NADH-FMN oxidoreductase RutF